jgi:hypothetical protein
MNIFKGLFRSRDKPAPQNYMSGLSFLFGDTPSGKTVNERTAMQITAVHACVKVIAEAVASLPLHVYQRKGDNDASRAYDYPLYNLLHLKPNTEMTAYTFIETAMQGKLNSTSKELTKVERRIDTLKKHIQQSEYFKEHRKLKRQDDILYAEYTAAKNETEFFAERKAKKVLEAVSDFREADHTGLTLYNATEKYLRGVLQERFDPKKLPPIDKWKEELTEKTSTKASLYREYYALQSETAKVEKFQRSVKEILHSETSEQTDVRPRGIVR